MKRFVKTLWDHPFFDYVRRRGAVLTPKEAARVMRAGVPSFEEMVEVAKARFADERVSWEIFDNVIAARRRRSSTVGWVYGHRRLAIAALVIALLLAFFTFTPTGRAMAEKFFNVVMRVMGTQVEFVNGLENVEAYRYIPDNLQTADPGYGDQPLYSETDSEYKQYEDVQDFTKKVGLKPLSFDNDFLTIRAIYGYMFEPDAIICVIEYITPEGLLVTTREQWLSKTNHVYEVDNATYTTETVLQDKEIVYTVSPLDGSFMGTILLKGSVFFIAAENGVKIEQLLAMMKEYKAPHD